MRLYVLIPLLTALTVCASQQQKELDQAFATTLGSTNPALKPVQDSLHGMSLTSGRATNYALAFSGDSVGLEDDENSIENTLSELEKHMHHLRQSSRNLSAAYGQLSEAERNATKVIADNADTVARDGTLQKMGVAGGIGIMCWLSGTTLRSYHTARSRFTGAEVAAGASVAGSTLKTLFGPLALAAVAGFAWYTLKQWIIEPYKQKHKKEIETYKEKLVQHRQETDQTITALKDEIRRVNAAMQQTQKEFEKTTAQRIGQVVTTFDTSVKNQLTVSRAYTDDQIGSMNRKYDHLRQDAALEHAALKKRLEDACKALTDENKKLSTRLEEEQEELANAIRRNNVEIRDDLEAARREIGLLKEHGSKVSTQIDATVAKQTEIMKTIQGLRASSETIIKLLKDKKIAALSPSTSLSSPRTQVSPSSLASPGRIASPTRGDERKDQGKNQKSP